ncbi:RmlC-like cupin domain-containing protein [Paraphoma chrysanthemicola]|nr:RmlC-like cupin domain-containing protein [Paraphoma chrysanthemicola]
MPRPFLPSFLKPSTGPKLASSTISPSNLTTLSPRKIARILPALATNEGVGATVHRAIGTPQLHHFSPFLMLDHAIIHTGQGFPDHPHRGQETISYILSGRLEHEDFAGHQGVLEAGDLQFMTAGRGIMHSEMPVPSHDGKPSEGLQVWVDLPAELKMCEPRYRDVRASEIKRVSADDGRVSVKVISGTSYGVESKHKDLSYTPVWYLDFVVQPGGRVVQAVPEGWNAFVYVLAGNVVVLGKSVEKRCIATLELEGDSFEGRVPEDATEDAHFVLIAGVPLEQPVVQHGPFVMTTREGVRQAVMDFVAHENGFERAKDWESQAEKRRKSLS